MRDAIVDLAPQFGVNYDIGYVGFTFRDSSFLSSGISYFTRWEKGENKSLPAIDISHVFMVSGENECVEAVPPKLTRSPLSKFFDPKDIHVTFRKPVNLNSELARRLINIANMRLGEKYDYSLILGHLMANTLLGRLLGFVTAGKSKDWLTKAFNSKHRAVCSEYVAWIMQQTPEYMDKGVLIHDACEIDPQDLFQDQVVFEPWALELKAKYKILPRI